MKDYTIDELNDLPKSKSFKERLLNMVFSTPEQKYQSLKYFGMMVEAEKKQAEDNKNLKP